MPQHFYPPGERTPPSYDFFIHDFVQLNFFGCLPILPGWLFNVHAAGPLPARSWSFTL